MIQLPPSVIEYFMLIHKNNNIKHHLLRAYCIGTELLSYECRRCKHCRMNWKNYGRRMAVLMTVFNKSYVKSGCIS